MIPHALSCIPETPALAPEEKCPGCELWLGQKYHEIFIRQEIDEAFLFWSNGGWPFSPLVPWIMPYATQLFTVRAGLLRWYCQQPVHRKRETQKSILIEQNSWRVWARLYRCASGSGFGKLKPEARDWERLSHAWLNLTWKIIG